MLDSWSELECPSLCSCKIDNVSIVKQFKPPGKNTFGLTGDRNDSAQFGLFLPAGLHISSASTRFGCWWRIDLSEFLSRSGKDAHSPGDHRVAPFVPGWKLGHLHNLSHDGLRHLRYLRHLPGRECSPWPGTSRVPSLENQWPLLNLLHLLSLGGPSEPSATPLSQGPVERCFGWGRGVWPGIAQGQKGALWPF